MNERTKQLWEESQQWNGSDDGRGGLKILESVEKFAELIVADCYQKLIDMDQQVKGSHNYYKHAAVQIKLHFGVEQ